MATTTTSLTTSPSAAKEQRPAAVEETNAQKLQRLNEENEAMKAELVNISLRSQVEQARRNAAKS